MTIDDYIDLHISEEPEILRSLYRHTHLTRLYPRMCTDHVQGSLLSMLTRMIRPKRILELGTFSGYSTLCFAGAMPPEAEIDTVEIDDEFTDELLALFDEAGYAGRIHLHTADASVIAPELARSNRYDLVFIDADKRRYADYYTTLLPLLPRGAYILADNTLWSEKILDPAAHDPQTEGIRRFNDLVAADPAVAKTIVPVRDGLTLIHKL